MRICYDSCETLTSLLYQTPLGFSIPPSLMYLYIYIYIYMSIYSLVKSCIINHGHPSLIMWQSPLFEASPRIILEYGKKEEEAFCIIKEVNLSILWACLEFVYFVEIEIFLLVVL